MLPKNPSKHAHLICVFSSSHVLYYVVDELSKQITHQQKETFKDFGHIQHKVNALFQKFDKKSISLKSEHYTWVPSSFLSTYTKEQLWDINFNTSISTNQIDHIDVLETQSTLLYQPPVYTNQLRKISPKELHPTQYILYKNLAQLSTDNFIFVLKKKDLIQVICFKEQTLKLFNYYTVSTSDDILYFIFLATEKIELNPETTSIFYISSDPFSNEQTILRQYFNVVEEHPLKEKFWALIHLHKS